MDAHLQKEKEAISVHYDLPPDFFKAFLGPKMAYSCAYFTSEDETLAEAEKNKLKLTAEKLELKKDERLLDVGCGWGSMLFYAAEIYHVQTTGISLAKEQVDYVNNIARKQGLSNQVSALLMHAYDMRFSKNSFDKIVTIGAIEHMEDLVRFFREVGKILKNDGLFLVHGMTIPWQSRQEGRSKEAEELVKEHWGIGYWHSLFEVIEALEKTGFEVLDVENITRHYQYTVERWLENLQAKESEIAGQIIPEEKYREFEAAMASYVVGFDFSSTICQQILCQKIRPGEPRPIRPFQRKDWSNV